MSSNSTAVIPSFAKINLYLEVCGIRADGYHPIKTVFQSISLHDELHCSHHDGEGLQLECQAEGVPDDDSNLICKAYRAFSEMTGKKPGLHIRLEKKIPVAAGLGGGSSNAASTLRHLNELSGFPLDNRQLAEIGANLGSDVPFFLVGGTAKAEGRGEILTPLDDAPAKELLLVKPDFGVSAAEAYALFDSLHDKNFTFEQESNYRNDLEAGVFEKYPCLAEIKQKILRHSAENAVMCGSGSTIAGIFTSSAAADSCEDVLKGIGPWLIRSSYICRDNYFPAVNKPGTI